MGRSKDNSRDDVDRVMNESNRVLDKCRHVDKIRLLDLAGDIDAQGDDPCEVLERAKRSNRQ